MHPLKLQFRLRFGLQDLQDHLGELKRVVLLNPPLPILVSSLQLLLHLDELGEGSLVQLLHLMLDLRPLLVVDLVLDGLGSVKFLVAVRYKICGK